MTQVTRLGGTIPILNKGAIGYDPAEVANSEDTPDPADLALASGGAVAEVPVALGGTVELVQSKTGNEGLGATISVTFDDAPTEGNLLLAVLAKRNVTTYQTTPTGWTEAARCDTGNVGDGGIAQMFYRVAGPSEPSTVSVPGGASEMRMVISEWGGVGQLDTVDTEDAQSASTTHTSPSVTPTAGLPALVVIDFLMAFNNETSVSPSAGYTEMDDAAANNSGGGLGPHHEVEYKIVATTSGSYSASVTSAASIQDGSIIAVFTPIDGGFLWTLAPNTIDDNSATYDAVPTATPE